MQRTEFSSEVDILIAGAGPIGLAAGIQLRTHGITNYRIIDKTVPPSLNQLTDFSRAIGVHARTLEILEDVDISHQLVDRGTIAHTGSYFYNDHMMYRLNYHSGCDKAHLQYPWNLMVTQGNTIDVLKHKLNNLGHIIEWEKSLIDLEQKEDHVIASILNEKTGETEVVRAKWLLGCDGAHSVVRKKLGIGFPGHVYPERWVVCDLNIDWDVPHDDIAFLGSKDAFAVTLPLKGWGDNRYRVTMIQPLEEDDPLMKIGHAIPTDEHRFTRADCEAFFKKIYPGAKVHCPDDAGNWFMVHCRLADNYRSGRCFLLGDAAHIHSPILGQGMNMGIQDATNIAWKLAAVLKGQSDVSLLDTYEIERRSMAESVIAFTDRTTKLITLRSKLAQIVRGYILRFLLFVPPSRRFLISKLMQLLMTYDQAPPTKLTRSSWLSSFTDRFRPSGPTAGDRCPDPGFVDANAQEQRLFSTILGNAFTVLFFVGSEKTSEAAIERLKLVAEQLIDRYEAKVQPVFVVTNKASAHLGDLATIEDPQGMLHDAFAANRPCVYVLRPDRHVGYRGHVVEGVIGYLDQIFNRVPTPTKSQQNLAEQQEPDYVLASAD